MILEFQYGQADLSVCYRNSEVWLYTPKKKFSEKNNKLVFHSSVIVTEGFGCFWDTFGGVRGPPGTQ